MKCKARLNKSGENIRKLQMNLLKRELTLKEIKLLKVSNCNFRSRELMSQLNNQKILLGDMMKGLNRKERIYKKICMKKFKESKEKKNKVI